MTIPLSRRQFLASSAAVGAGVLLPGTAAAANYTAPPPGPPYWDRVLILIELDGGNDGLNTVIPFDVAEYNDLRPNLRYSENALEDAGTILTGRTGTYQTTRGGVSAQQQFALNPGMTHLRAAWNPTNSATDDLAIVLGVGYANGNLSHFRSMDIWNGGATAADFPSNNWLGRLFSGLTPPSTLTAHGALLSRYSSNPLRSATGVRYLAMAHPFEFIKRSYEVIDADPATVSSPQFKHLLTTAHEVYQASGKFRGAMARLKTDATTPYEADDYEYNPPSFTPSSGITFNDKSAFERGCRAIAEMIATNRSAVAADKRLQIPVFKIQIGGFDTHAGQRTSTVDRHGDLLAQVSSGMASIRAALKQHPGLWERTLIMTYSEFGRRVEENASSGTDHGTSSCHLLLGGGIKGGFYGAQPGLWRQSWNSQTDDLDDRGNLKYTVDFRNLYATAASWLGLPFGSDPYLGSATPLDCFATP